MTVLIWHFVTEVWCLNFCSQEAWGGWGDQSDSNISWSVASPLVLWYSILISHTKALRKGLNLHPIQNEEEKAKNSHFKNFFSIEELLSLFASELNFLMNLEKKEGVDWISLLMSVNLCRKPNWCEAYLIARHKVSSSTNICPKQCDQI